MPVKVLNSSGSGSASDVAVGIRWAADNGADIINLSIGGPGLAGLQVLQDAIGYAFNSGILVVAAAGNDAAVTGGNLNVNEVSPVCMDGGQNYVIGVAALDAFDKKAGFSNYGSNCIDISAPGAGTFIDKDNKQGIVSTYFDPSRPGEQNLYVYAVGTSLATPIVSGVAALTKAKFPGLDVLALRNRIIAAADDISLQNTDSCGGNPCVNHLGSGRINAYKALSAGTAFSEGSLVANELGEIFLIENELKRPVSSFVFGQRFTGSAVTQSEQSVLDKLPTGKALPPSDGTFIKDTAAPLVYLVEGGLVRPLSLVAFASRASSFSQIVVLGSAEVASYMTGSDAAVLDGVLLKGFASPAVYILQNGNRKLLSFFVFKQRGFDNRLIAELPDSELFLYPFNSQDYLFPPLDGTLVRGTQDPTVYLIESGRRRAMNFDAFVNRGFSFENVITLPQSEVGGYEQSDTIIE
jgi:hypothetical protein